MKKYDLLLADPPWSYNNKSSNGAADNHYNTTDPYSLERLHVEDIASDNSVLCMWYTGNFALEAIKLAEAWNFKVKNMFCFAWVKLNKNAGDRIDKNPPEDAFDFMEILNNETKINCGNYTRQNIEMCLVATRGKGLPRRSASVRQIVYSCLGEHSEKPKEVHHRLEELYGDVPRIELFAREKYGEWDVYGDQVNSDIQLR
ncbi:DNA methyltransferase [Morganella morganii]|uniref:MT-A70 family methyltransferase n=1 Tax=Morganella morganii TaxID=582 RepID=UPI00062C9286|nr:MT-A70 family methyltransferase [Morganella morganii]KKY70294.1 DNA methyltransferase [Morganella morganii]